MSSVGERSSVWRNVTIRGDVNSIRIGEESNVQDNCVIHVEHDIYSDDSGQSRDRRTFGRRCTAASIEDDCLIGIGAIVLNGAQIGKGTVIAAGALVPEGMEIPPGSMVMGVPAR